MTNKVHSIKPQISIPLFGIIGGLLLVFIAGKEQNAITVIPIFGITLLTSTLTVKINNPKKAFFELFMTALLTFVVMVLIDFIYLINVVNPNLLNTSLIDDLWRFAIVFLFGAIVSLKISYISSTAK